MQEIPTSEKIFLGGDSNGDAGKDIIRYDRVHDKDLENRMIKETLFWNLCWHLTL